MAVLYLDAGCVPVPHHEILAPAVSGLVVQAGVPVTGAEIQVEGLLKERRSTITGPDGRFKTDPIQELRLTTLLVGDRLYAYTVGILAEGKSYKGYSEAGMGNAPDKLELVCDLSGSIKHGNREIYCKVGNLSK